MAIENRPERFRWPSRVSRYDEEVGRREQFPGTTCNLSRCPRSSRVPGPLALPDPLAGGDRLALVALALLIYDRTRSPLLAAIAYAAGTLPYLIGALFLSGLADRFPRREVMVTCDVVRAALVAPMLVPRMPLDVLIALLYAVTAFQPPFDAARSAILRDIVQGEHYALAAAIMQSTFLAMVVAGAAAAA